MLADTLAASFLCTTERHVASCPRGPSSMQAQLLRGLMSLAGLRQIPPFTFVRQLTSLVAAFPPGQGRTSVSCTVNGVCEGFPYHVC